MTHAELVVRAARWLKRKCSVVLTELVTTGETPDAIGWHGTLSILIECKATRSDFLADRQKAFRVCCESGMGALRYYMTPKALVEPQELPAGWGLLEIWDDSACQVVKPTLFMQWNHRAEAGLLLSALRRVGHNAPRPISIRCYTIESRNTATLSVLPPDEASNDL